MVKTNGAERELRARWGDKTRGLKGKALKRPGKKRRNAHTLGYVTEKENCPSDSYYEWEGRSGGDYKKEGGRQ